MKFQWPFVTRTKYLADMNMLRERSWQERKRYDAEQAKEREVLKRYLERMSATHVYRDYSAPLSDVYTICTKISPELIGFGGMEQDCIDMIADEIGKRVTHEIRRSKFVRPSNIKEM